MRKTPLRVAHWIAPSPLKNGRKFQYLALFFNIFLPNEKLETVVKLKSMKKCSKKLFFIGVMAGFLKSYGILNISLQIGLKNSVCKWSYLPCCIPCQNPFYCRSILSLYDSFPSSEHPLQNIALNPDLFTQVI